MRVVLIGETVRLFLFRQWNAAICLISFLFASGIIWNPAQDLVAAGNVSTFATRLASINSYQLTSLIFELTLE